MSLGIFFCSGPAALSEASREKGKVVHIILKNHIESGSKRELFPVHPKTDKICGLKCCPSVLNIPVDRQYGIIKSNTGTDFLNYAIAFSCQALPKDKKVAIIKNMGGWHSGN